MEHIFDIPNKPLSSEKFHAETGWHLNTLDAHKLVITGDCTKEQALAALQAHDGTMPEKTVEEKLASVGLNLNDLKTALGLA
jgi:hypothetical protein